MRIRNKITIFLLLLAAAAGVAGYWYYQKKIFSKGDLKLEILGPESVQMGENIEYTLRYKNNGNLTLEDSKLIFEFPENSLVEDGKTRITKDLEDIYPGQENILQFEGRLFGKENELKVARAWLSYELKNLEGSFESETTFTSKIEFIPLTLEFDLPSKLETGREIQFSLNYFSNLDYSFSDLRLEVEYPENFEFLGAEPRGLEENEWEIPFLEKAEGGRIKIRGKLEEEAGRKQNFKAKLGMWQEGELILLKETEKEIEVINPLLYISQRINGVSNHIASPGEKLHYEIFFKNIGTTPFENQFLLARLEGNAFDLSTLEAGSGEYKSNDNLIIWDWKQVPSLEFLDVQAEGKVEFDVEIKESWLFSESEKEAVIENKVNIAQISEEFRTKVSSKLEIIQEGYFQDEIFGNSGPLPPKTGETTTFTILWRAKNYYNDVKNVKAKATLPQGVELTGKISPQEQSSKFSYDSQSREIVWVITDGEILEAGTGIMNPAPNVVFQVALNPSSGQAGNILPIINEVKIDGEDQWTGMVVESVDEGIDTTLPDDPTANEE